MISRSFPVSWCDRDQRPELPTWSTRLHRGARAIGEAVNRALYRLRESGGRGHSGEKARGRLNGGHQLEVQPSNAIRMLAAAARARLREQRFPGDDVLRDTALAYAD